MKKHILTSFHLFLLCSLFLSTVSIVRADRAIPGEMLPKKPGFVARARQEFKNAQAEHTACRKMECTEEKKLYEIAKAELNKKGASNEEAVRANQAYDARELCLQQQCAEKYKKMKTAEKKYNRRKIGRAAAIAAAAVGATALVIGGSALLVSESDAIKDEKKAREHRVTLLINMGTDNEKTLLSAFANSPKHTFQVANSNLKDKSLSPDAVKAAYIIYYSHPSTYQPTESQLNWFKRTFSIQQKEAV